MQGKTYIIENSHENAHENILCHGYNINDTSVMEYFDDILTCMNDCNIIISNNNDNYKIKSTIDSICNGSSFNMNINHINGSLYLYVITNIYHIIFKIGLEIY